MQGSYAWYVFKNMAMRAMSSGSITPKGANTKRDTHRRQLQIKQEQPKDYRTRYPQSIKMVDSRVRNRKQLLWRKRGPCSLPGSQAEGWSGAESRRKSALKCASHRFRKEGDATVLNPSRIQAFKCWGRQMCWRQRGAPSWRRVTFMKATTQS